MTSEHIPKKRKFEHIDAEKELEFFDALEISSTSSELTSRTPSSENTPTVSNVHVPSTDVCFSLSEAHMRSVEYQQLINEQYEELNALEDLFLDGCSRAYDNEATPFAEFENLLWDIDLERDGLDRDNDRRLARIKNLITIANKCKTSGKVTLVGQTATNWHAACYERHWYSYTGENLEQC